MKRIRMLFAGDIVITNDRVNTILSPELHKVFAGHDIRSCNFEAPLLSNPCKHIDKAGPHLHQCPQAAQIVKNDGFNLISLANNHIADFGQEGLAATIEAFNGTTIVGAGLSQHDVYSMKTLEVNSIRIGFISLAEWGFGAAPDLNAEGGGFAWIGADNINGLIQKSKKEVNLLIVQAHCGVEEIDIPLPQWRERYRSLIQSGADIVIGHHPHVPQGWEKFQDGAIFYSLGNFFFDVNETSPYWNYGYLASLEFSAEKLLEIQTIPIQRIDTKVTICEQKSYLDHMENICHLLNAPVYGDTLRTTAIDLWNKRYLQYYTASLNLIPHTFKIRPLLRFVLRRLLKKPSINPLLLLHNLRIESHRFAVEKAMEILSMDNVRKK